MVVLGLIDGGGHFNLLSVGLCKSENKEDLGRFLSDFVEYAGKNGINVSQKIDYVICDGSKSIRKAVQYQMFLFLEKSLNYKRTKCSCVSTT